MQTTNGWNEYKRLILAEIKQAKEDRKEIIDKCNQTLLDVQELKVKTGIISLGVSILFGSLAGGLIRYFLK